LNDGSKASGATEANLPQRTDATNDPIISRAADDDRIGAPALQSLAGAHRRTFDTIFQHPVSHNLRWRDVHALFRQLGQVEEKAKDSFFFTRNGETVTLPTSRTKISDRRRRS